MVAVTRRVQRQMQERFDALKCAQEAGMSTAEYAVGTIAAVAFAAVLIAVVKSDTVKAALEGIISTALGTR